MEGQECFILRTLATWQVKCESTKKSILSIVLFPLSHSTNIVTGHINVLELHVCTLSYIQSNELSVELTFCSTRRVQ